MTWSPQSHTSTCSHPLRSRQLRSSENHFFYYLCYTIKALCDDARLFFEPTISLLFQLQRELFPARGGYLSFVQDMDILRFDVFQYALIVGYDQDPEVIP